MGLNSGLGSIYLSSGTVFSRIASMEFRAGFNVGALVVRIGFWVYYATDITRNPKSSIGNYLGPYSRLRLSAGFRRVSGALRDDACSLVKCQ